ncbi:MAG: porin family protein [Acidobacteria bacterium]|nr:porin family protein [Acidobacteriota bacterium]MDW7984336.1 outer membrane beta-barrel protein [Acidobacteriota bacterium]
MRWTSWTGVGLGLLALGAQVVWAAETPTIGLGAQGAWTRPKDADHALGYVGAHLRLRPLAWLGLEGALDYRKESYADGSITVRDVPVTASVLVFVIPRGPFNPYLMGGTGVHFTRTEAGTVSTSDAFMGYHVGAGLQVVLGDVALFGEYRYMGVKIHAAVGPHASRLSLDASGSNLRVGLTFWF